MNDETFEKIHAAFVKMYNIDEGAYHPTQRPYVNLRAEVRVLIEDENDA